ncbi:MAG: hypothetical protein CMI09_11655 [Oceanospirillaceae bacterium]|nr:hypothetical protein [Oceanospirillaceae bacterium]
MSASHSWQDDTLRQRGSDPLREAGSVRPEFDQVRSPISSSIHTATYQGAQQRGSTMVQQEQPKPALKPKHSLSQLRQSFQERWQIERDHAHQHQEAHTHVLQNTTDHIFPENQPSRD